MTHGETDITEFIYLLSCRNALQNSHILINDMWKRENTGEERVEKHEAINCPSGALLCSEVDEGYMVFVTEVSVTRSARERRCEQELYYDRK